MTKKHRKGVALDKLKVYLMLGSLLTTWLAGDLLAQRERAATAIAADTSLVVGEMKEMMPQVVARSRSSR